MASEYYIVDTTRKRRLMLGKVTGAFLHQWMLDRKSFDVREIVQAFVDFGERDARERRYDFDPEEFRRFAVKVWAFCALAGWFHEVRWAGHDYDDEYLPVTHQWGTSRLDPEWKTIGSWYSRDDLDADPLAGEMGRLEKVALLAAEKEGAEC